MNVGLHHIANLPLSISQNPLYPMIIKTHTAILLE